MEQRSSELSSYGNLIVTCSDYFCSCWISVENPKMGAIWAFAVPMLVVILVSPHIKKSKALYPGQFFGLFGCCFFLIFCCCF